MNVLRAGLLTIGLSLFAQGAAAQTEETCTKGDCEYRFDDEDVNTPGWSAYEEWLRVRGPAQRVLLIRPRVSFVMELVKSMNGL